MITITISGLWDNQNYQTRLKIFLTELSVSITLRITFSLPLIKIYLILKENLYNKNIIKVHNQVRYFLAVSESILSRRTHLTFSQQAIAIMVTKVTALQQSNKKTIHTYIVQH